eukprot:gene34108-biopygen12970
MWKSVMARSMDARLRGGGFEGAASRARLRGGGFEGVASRGHVGVDVGTGAAVVVEDVEDGPLFCTEDAKGRLKPLTHSVFVAVFRKLAARAGLDPAAFTGHSFHRGGATAAFKLRVQDALIQAHGDWASECYKLYCDMDSAQQLILPSAMASDGAAATRAFQMRA